MKIPFLKTNVNTRRRRRKPGFWSTLIGARRGDTTLPANVTGEDDWEVEVPHIKMSRAFIIMLVLHIVAIGGLVAFNVWGKDSSRKAAEQAGASQTGSDESKATLPVSEELRTHVFQSTDTLPLIAARYNVSVADLEAANIARTIAPGVNLTIPSTPRRIGPADIASTDPDPLEPSPISNELVSNPPPVESVPDMPLDVIPDDLKAASGPVAITSKPAETDEDADADAGDSPARAAKKDRDVVDPTPPPAVGKVRTTPAPGKPAPASKPAGQRTHVVTKGDTVFNVARKYNCTPSEIMKLNGIGNNARIGVGQILKVPVKR